MISWCYQERLIKFLGSSLPDVGRPLTVAHVRSLPQDGDMMRRWRKWWCEVDDGSLKCTLHESLRLVEPPRIERRGQSSRHADNKVASTRLAQEGLDVQPQVR